MEEDYYFGSYGKGQILTAQEYLTFAKNFLIRLSHFDSRFSRFYSWGDSPKAGTWLGEDFQDFEEIVFEHINDEETRFQNPDPDNWDITLESKSPIGFLNTFSTAKKGEDQISISISAGYDDNYSIIIKFESNYHLKDFSFVKALFEHTINYSKPKWAVFISHEFIDKVAIENSISEIGWLTYFADKSIAQYLPSDTDYEILPEGGVLIKLKDEMPSAENQQDVNAAIKIRDSLVNNGITDWEQLTHKA